MEASTTITVRLDRDSVHPGDDCESHAERSSISSSATIGEFLRQIRETGFLPGIAGGEAAWIVDCTGCKTGCLGVLAQQWQEPRLVIPDDTPIKDLALSHAPGFYFRYWCQADPEQVFACVRTGKELPDKFR